MKINWTHVTLALLIGLLIGWFAGTRALREEMHHWKEGKPTERLTRELGLTADQKDKVTKVLESKREQITALRNEIRPRFEEIRNTSKAEIRKLLTPEQQKKFDTLAAEMSAARQKRQAEWAGK